MTDRATMMRLYRERRDTVPDLERWSIQLGLGGCPYRVCVACMLLNRTTCRQVRPVLRTLLSTWPCAELLAIADREFLWDVVKPLGLGFVRSRNLLRFAREFVSEDWGDIEDLHCVGKYAVDAVRIFCLGDLTVEPTDKVLSAFLRALR